MQSNWLEMKHTREEKHLETLKPFKNLSVYGEVHSY